MKYIEENIFTTKHQTIVNTVNCFGIMGTGLALEFKYRYPEMFIRYKELCKNKQFNIGQLYLYKTPNRWILNFPTKNHWKFETKPEYIEKGLQKFIDTYKEKGITSIAFPLLGTNNGGLAKEKSIELIEKYLKNIDIPIEVYSYNLLAHDDIFPFFRSAIFNTSTQRLSKILEIKEKKIALLKDYLSNNDLNSMTQIQNLKGLGDSSIAKFYSFAMQHDTINIQLNIF